MYTLPDRGRGWGGVTVFTPSATRLATVQQNGEIMPEKHPYSISFFLASVLVLILLLLRTMPLFDQSTVFVYSYLEAC